MKNYRRSLPPLDHFLFFEAVARHGSFTRAAEELNVSQAAVSKRVKALEARVATPLVARNGRRVALTAAGRGVATAASEALDHLNFAMLQLRRASEVEPLSLAANVAVSQFWLTPRVNEFLLGPGASPVTLTASDKDADLFALNVDAVIFYGTDIPSGWEGRRLFEEIWSPVAAPDLVASARGPMTGTLLDFEKATPKWLNWLDFAELTERPELAAAQRVTLPSYAGTLEAAVRGKGFALGCPDVLDYEIAAGRLATLAGYQLSTGRSYFVIWRTGGMSEPKRALLGEIGVRV